MKMVSKAEYQVYLDRLMSNERALKIRATAIIELQREVEDLQEQLHTMTRKAEVAQKMKNELEELRDYRVQTTDVIQELATLQQRLEDQAALKVQLDETGRDLRAARQARDNAKAGFTRLKYKVENLQHELWDMSGGERGKEHPSIKAAEIALIESDLPDE